MTVVGKNVKIEKSVIVDCLIYVCVGWMDGWMDGWMMNAVYIMYVWMNRERDIAQR